MAFYELSLCAENGKDPKKIEITQQWMHSNEISLPISFYTSLPTFQPWEIVEHTVFNFTVCVCEGIANVARSYIAIELAANRAIQLLCGSFDLIILQPGQSQLPATATSEVGEKSGKGVQLCCECYISFTKHKRCEWQWHCVFECVCVQLMATRRICPSQELMTMTKLAKARRL